MNKMKEIFEQSVQKIWASQLNEPMKIDDVRDLIRRVFEDLAQEIDIILSVHDDDICRAKNSTVYVRELIEKEFKLD